MSPPAHRLQTDQSPGASAGPCGEAPAAVVVRSAPRIERGHDLIAILAIAILGLTVRAIAVVFFTGTIDTEGAEYARIAQNLLAGVGYVGIATPGTQLFFPPLFSYLIAAISLLTHDVESAGRIVSLVMGTLLVLPVYFIARHFYGRAAASIAAVLIALHPLLIGFSSTVFSESATLTLLATAVYATLRAYRSGAAMSYGLAGAAFGLTYLIRPEATAYMLVALTFGLGYGLLFRRSDFLRIARRAVWLPIAFAVLAAPYVVWLHGQTGQWRLEGKSALNYATGRQAAAGIPLHEVSYKIDSDLTERGVWIKPNIATIRSERIAPQELLRYIAGKAKQVMVDVRNTIAAGTAYGSPPLFALAVLGLYRRPWDRESALDQLFILTVLGMASSALFFIYYFSDRFLLPFLPFLVIWASHGILAFERWFARSATLVFGRRPGPAVRLLIVALTTAVIPLTALTAVANVWELKTFSAGARPVKIAGQWLNAQAAGAKTIMDTSAILPFHASAKYVPFPYTDSDTALRYLDKRQVDFIVLRDFDVATRPYLKSWLENGIPSPRAELVYKVDEPEVGRIFIYKWSAATAPRG